MRAPRLGLLLALVLPPSQPGAQTNWTLETPEPAGYYQSLAIDRSGNSHLVYEGAGGVRYAVRDATSWAIETIPQSSSYDLDNAGTALVLDASGYAHVIFVLNADEDFEAAEVHYATNASGAWQNREIEYSYYGYAYGVSIALDNTGTPAVAYGTTGSWNGGGGLRFASARTNWQIEQVPGTDCGVPRVTSLVFGSDGMPRICGSCSSSSSLYAVPHRSTLGGVPQVTILVGPFVGVDPLPVADMPIAFDSCDEGA